MLFCWESGYDGWGMRRRACGKKCWIQNMEDGGTLGIKRKVT